jgi:short-subunit dehydrogenase
MEFRNKTIVITGASAGIGREIALLLARKGARLVLLARNEQRLRETEAEIKRITPDVLAIPFDVLEGEKTGQLMTSVLERFGSIDILINNAGLGLFGTIEKMSMSDFDRVVRTNIYGLLYMTKAAIPFLRQSKGMIVNISSALSKRALPFLAAYAGTKSMLDALSDGLRLELREYGIKVLNYCPPAVDTGFADNSLKNAGMDPDGERRNMKRARVNDIAVHIVRSIKKEKREVVYNKSLKIMNFFAPRWVDYIFYKSMVLRIKH